MPVTPTYPGVYIQEIPSGVRTITPVPTSVTAFVGRALKGPVNEPKMCNNYGDFVRIFGGLWAESTMSYAVRDFFLNGGSQALIVRLFNPRFKDEEEREREYNKALGEAEVAAKAVIKAASDKAKDVAEAGSDKKDEDVEAIIAAAVAAVTLNSSTLGAAAAAEFVVKAIRLESEKAPPLEDAQAAIEEGLNVITATPQAILDGIDKMLEEIGKVTAEDPAVEKAAIEEAATLVANNPDFKGAEGVLGEILTAVKDAQDKDGALAAVNARKAAETEVHGPLLDAALAISTAVRKAIDAEKTVQDLGLDAKKALRTQMTAEGAVAEQLRKMRQVIDAAISPPPSAKAIIDAINDAGLQEIAAGVGANQAAPRGRAEIVVGKLKLRAKYDGSWGNGLRARVTTATKDPKDPKMFNLYVRDGQTGRVESFLNVTTDDSVGFDGSGQPRRYVKEIVGSESKLVEVTGVPTIVDASGPAGGKGITDESKAWDVNEDFSTGVAEADEATDGRPLDAGNYAGDESKKEGIFALERAEIFNLLCIPALTPDVPANEAIVEQAMTYCKGRRAFYLIDVPPGWADKDAAKEGMNDLGVTKSDHAAMFFPWLRMSDPARGGAVSDFPPCGAVAGVIARTDATRGIWKAPAGLEATVAVPELSVNLSDPENGELNPLGLNCLRSFPTGRTIWGARTLQGDDRFASEYKYIPVRRLALHIENSLYRGLQWVVFEPNDEPLWSQIRLNVGAFMHGLFRQGAFQGVKSKDAYFVKCDSETTTATDQNLGIVNILVGFAPLKPAEFVILSLQQMARKEE